MPGTEGGVELQQSSRPRQSWESWCDKASRKRECFIPDKQVLVTSVCLCCKILPGWGLPWWSRGQDSMLPAQGAQAQPLIRRLSPTIKKWSSQIDKMTKSHLWSIKEIWEVKRICCRLKQGFYLFLKKILNKWSPFYSSINCLKKLKYNCYI